MLQLRRAAIWAGILITFLFAIFPDLVVQYLPFLGNNSDLAIRLFSGVNAILLAALSVAQETLGSHFTIPAEIGGVGTPLPSLDAKNPSPNSEPQQVLLIISNFASFREALVVERFLKRAAILANFKPLVVNDTTRITQLLKNTAIKGVVADRSLYEKVIISVQQSPATLFIVYPNDSFNSSRLGPANRIGMPEEEFLDGQLVSQVAKVLAGYHGPDTPSGIGFHGNWAGTYGILSLHQDNNFKVRGSYWYAGGKMSGECLIDERNEQMVFRFQWNQRKGNSLPILTPGSENQGQGVMVIPAGYPLLYGYWCPGEDQNASQCWCAARLAADITDDILAGGEFAKNLGLNQHLVSELVAW